MIYKNFSKWEFVLDEYFQQWVTNPGMDNHNFWVKWMRENPDKQGEIEEARRMVLTMKKITQHKDVVLEEKIWREITHAIDDNDKYYIQSDRYSLKYYSIAASILLVIISGVVLWVMTSREDYTEFSSNYGEIKSVLLPDSSLVTINSNSNVRYAVNKELAAREVWIEGEAFFEIKEVKNKNFKKFIVHTKNFDIEVLGTRFNVNNRRGSSSVVLNSGIIKLTNAKVEPLDGNVMKPGEMVEISDEQNNGRKAVVNPSVFNSWTSGNLIFERTRLKDIALRLEDLYGIRVKFEQQALEELTFTANIKLKDNTPEILFALLSQSFNIEIDVGEKRAIFKEKL